MDPSKRVVLGRIAELKARSKRERRIGTAVVTLSAALVLAETIFSGSPDETLVLFVPIVFYIALLILFRTEQLKDLQMLARAMGIYPGEAEGTG